MAKTTTKGLYQELIKQTLIDNDVRTMTFKGNDNFAKKETQHFEFRMY